MQNDMILEKIKLLRPDKIIDVGCGLGGFTAQLSPFCNEIIAVDVSQELIDRCIDTNSKPNIKYITLNAKNLNFPDNYFGVAFTRGTLHHTPGWEEIMDEMVRVTSDYILIMEPVDDFRSDEKKNSHYAQKLYIEIENAIDYPSFEYIPPEKLLDYFRRRNIPFECEIARFDIIQTFDEYFELYNYFLKEKFTEKPDEKNYWIKRLQDLRREFEEKGMKLCRDDIMYIKARKSAV
jgi:SAM-dependent methyltransferase